MSDMARTPLTSVRKITMKFRLTRKVNWLRRDASEQGALRSEMPMSRPVPPFSPNTQKAWQGDVEMAS